MNAEIISIGDELLVGQVVNTNASWIAQQLHGLGIPVNQIRAIADERNAIMEAVDSALSRSEVVFITGGLGPTRDDITKHTLCDYFGVKLVIHEPTLAQIRKFFAARGWELSETNRKQAEVPEHCIPIINYLGTAPGMWFEKDGKILVSMPGVPFEMEAMMEQDILPRLASKDNDVKVVHRTVQTHGVGESLLMEMIREWEEALPGNFRLAYLPSPGIVRLRLTAFGQDKAHVTAQVEARIAALRKLIPDQIYGYENETMEEVVGKLLREHHLSLSTAESCTGGYLAHLITSVPGASDYYPGSVIAYANEIKLKVLGVTDESLNTFGAVSEAVVRQMADGVRTRFGTDYALATSGIAGPNGGTVEKPVGLVWVALAGPVRTIAQKFMFGEHRGRNIRRSALAALNLLRLEILKSSLK